MIKRYVVFPIVAIVTVLIISACGGGQESAKLPTVSTPVPPENQTGVAALATPLSAPTSTQIPQLEPTAVPPTAAPAPTATVAAPSPTATPVPTKAPAPATSSETPATFDRETLTALTLSDPKILGCLTGVMGMATLLELAQREPTDEEMLLITPCLPDEQAAAPVVAEIEPTKAPEPVLQEVLVAPEGVPWYDGPLFDTHMHLISLTNPFYGRLVTTAEVTRLMNRHNVQAAIGFYLTPVIGRQVEVDALLQAVEDLDERIVSLLMPPPFDFGFPFGFMGFSAGTYTRALLEPWYPPYGTFDGFGEIPFYVDNLNSIDPLDSQLDAVYPLVAESKGVVMIHPDQSQSTESYAEVMRRYPEITFLYHGSKDFHGTENHRKVIIELLETYEGDNFYYTVDSGSILHENSLEEGSSIQMDSDSSEQFVELMNRFGVQNLAQHAYDEYSDVIIANPDLLMWGTDILPSWHFDEASADMIIDFSRRFIGLLPEEIQEKFAYVNAQRVFSRYLDD